MYVDDILAISVVATSILKSLEGIMVQYKNSKIYPPEMYLGDTLQKKVIKTLNVGQSEVSIMSRNPLPRLNKD